MLPEKIWELMARDLSGEASEADRQELRRLLEAHPELRETMAAAASLRTDEATESAVAEMSSRGWDQLKAQVETPAVAATRHVRRLWPLIGWAAAILALVLLTYNWWQRPAWIELATNAEKDSMQLPDGSKIFLNTNTTLRYARNYGKGSREMILDKGEAFFEVAALPQNPFTVHAGNLDIKVLGTAFNVHRSAGGAVEVFVSSGSVRTETRKGGSRVLEAGAQVAVSEKTQEIKTVDTRKDNVVAWKTGRLVFNRMPLSEVAVVLAGYYQLDVVVTDSTVARKELQATFNNKPLDEVLSVIGKALHVNIRQKEKALEFRQ